jgi:xylulose-5-phosphate/fructose-6-phosphate phosphoketolase
MLSRADALWRAATYVVVALLHLDENQLLAEPLKADHVKRRPAGHWGTVPGTAWALAHTTLAAGELKPDRELVPVIGAGHAGVVQLAYAWLTGRLASVRPQYSRDAAGLRRLARDFPHVGGLGSETHPLLPMGAAPGGCLGGALAFSHGLALDTPGRTAVPIIGDGECETPTTAAAWLAARTLKQSAVLPIVHVNGFRMGAESLLGAKTDAELVAYAAGQGWRARVVHVAAATADEHESFRNALTASADEVANGTPTAVFLRCVKGWSGPESVEGRPVLGTADAHKTPLSRARKDEAQREQLERWLASYRPGELFDHDAQPIGTLAAALESCAWHPAAGTARFASEPPGPVVHTRAGRFGEAVGSVLRRHAAAGGFRVFSPDELSSNRLGALRNEPWVCEVLAEEVLLGWLSGWISSGRRGVLVSYEAFAPLLTSGIVSHLKHRRLAGDDDCPSLNLLLTSYGWHNVFTHGDPSLPTALLATEDPAVSVLVPADTRLAAAALDTALSSTGRVNVLIAGKHTELQLPYDTAEEELTRGLAIWPHLSDQEEPDLTIVVAGDLPAEVVTAAVPGIRDRLGCRIRVVGVLDLTVLGDPQRRPNGLTDTEAGHYLGEHAAVLVVTLGHPAAVWGLLAGRLRRPVEVIGWREPSRPMPQDALAHELGLDVAGLLHAARRLTTGAGERDD